MGEEVLEHRRNKVDENGLQHPMDKAIVNLDPVLAQAVLFEG